MSKIVFEPFVGPLYRHGAVRLLLVGESHYGKLQPGEDPREGTRTVMRMWQSREWAIRYLTIGARIITGLRAWEIDRHAAYADVAFYNFVQVIMPTVRHRPTSEQARGSWDAFREVLDQCDLTHVVATGPGFLWSNMPPSDGRVGQFTSADEVLPLRSYRTRSGSARAIVIPHLSRASAPRWHGPVRFFLGQ